MNTVRRRGFVMMMAIIVLMLLGIALVAMTGLLSHQSRRTSSAGDDAQLRQVLIAAEAWTARQLAAGSLPPDWSAAVPLPPSLAALGVEAEVRMIADDTERTMMIVARLPERHLDQTVRYRMRGDLWRPVSAAISR